MKKKVIIAGTAPTSEWLITELKDTQPGYKRWGLAWSQYHQLYDRLFEIHPFDHNRHHVPENYDQLLLDAGKRVWRSFPSRQYPDAQVIPINDVIKCIGRNYFMSSMAYMTALAMYEGFEEIYLIGLDFGIQEKPEIMQLANLEWLMGLAEGRGIKVVPDPCCDLLNNPYMYGYHWNTQAYDMPEQDIRKYLYYIAGEINELRGDLNNAD